MSDLIITNTNSATDSEGTAFGLSGNLFVYLLGSMVVSILGVTLMISVLGVPVVIALPLGVVPVVLTLAYLKIFRHGKPPHYQEDLFELWLSKSGGLGHERMNFSGGRGK